MSASRIILASLLSFCQKLSELVEILRSSDKNNFVVFFETRCISLMTKKYIVNELLFSFKAYVI